MNTPIYDFVDDYIKKNTLRLHMPGHKGKGDLGIENRDITEIKGADSLFEADSVIKESEQNASTLFSCHTYYSTEGSSLCIRAMMYLVTLFAKERKSTPFILAARNAHKSFLSAVALNGVDVEWFYSDNGYLSCDVDALELDKMLCSMVKKPTAFYITSPDYLGNVADVRAIADVCHKHDVLLLVDNAHGAYLKFLGESLHPVDLGADMCCDSAHKTLPVLTSGAYLHIAYNAPSVFYEKAKQALSLFASTSPSYLVLQSLDMANKYLSDGYKERLCEFVKSVDKLKKELTSTGYTLVYDEPLKVTIDTKSYGYFGYDIADILRSYNIECEFCDPDFVVLMLSESMSALDIDTLLKAMQSIKQLPKIHSAPPKTEKLRRELCIRDAMFSNSTTVDVKRSKGKVCAQVAVSCPPAVPIVVCGEVIDDCAIRCFEYYGITKCDIITE